jgi:hypothetical protein
MNIEHLMKESYDMKTKNQQKTFLVWVHKNRLKIGLLAFFVLVPIALIITAYVGTYVGSQRFYFTQERTDLTEYISDFITADEINDFNLEIEWTTLRLPIADDEGKLINGQYGFSVTYTQKPNYVVNNVRVTPLLQTDWARMRSVGSTVTLNEGVARALTVNFNFELPTRPLWFVTVEEPNLYLMITYTRVLAGNPVEQVVYVQYSLNGLNPKNVLPS